MSKLDDIKFITGLDKSRMIKSIEELDLQFLQTWQEIKKIKLPPSYKKVKNIVLSGMGGSGLAGRLVKTLFSDRLGVPIDHIHDYLLPGNVNQGTLYVVASYSGNTEEPISTLTQAVNRGAKIVIIASGGKLAKAAEKLRLPSYIFQEKHNPSNQPRMGLGYNLGSLMGILKRLAILKISDADFLKSLKALKSLDAKFSLATPTSKNTTKKIAKRLSGKIPVIIASEFLEGNAHIFRNQINENGKNYADYFIIPELNHHLLEGMINPKNNQRILNFIFFNSKLYHRKNQKRFKVTQQVLTRQKIAWQEYRLTSGDKLSQSFEMLLGGSYISFYLAVLNKINPSPIPWVDYFKKQLSKK